MLVPERFRRQCNTLRVATLVVLLSLAVLMAMGMGSQPWPQALVADPGWEGRAAMTAVRFLPGFGYLWALWAVQRALGDLAAGRLFHLTVARAIRHVGLGVLIGALLNVFAVINLWRWIVGGDGSYAYFDVSGIVLGVVGAALVLLARLIDRARALQDELDAIL